MTVDWGFWIMYLLAVLPGFVGGWVLRGMVAREEAEERDWVARSCERERQEYDRGVERAKRHHPAYREGERR